MIHRPLRVACLGECMIELAHQSPSDLKLAYGGDTLNTAIYLNRLTAGLDVTVDYVTALGDDAYSEAMLALWQDEGLGINLVTKIPGRLPGLYSIRTDEQGERHFTYWRGQSAAKDFLRDGRDKSLAERLRHHDLLYLSGITLSILDNEQREALLGLIDDVRQQGAKIAFDSNYRPAGWHNRAEACRWFDAALQQTDIALPTYDDEQALRDSSDAAETARYFHELGVKQVVVKLGPEGCLLSTYEGKEILPTEPVDDVVDSTAAGDSFNAAYLGGVILGAPPDVAAKHAHRLAGRILRHRGAIIPKDAMADLLFEPRAKQV
ncbi:MAG: sugar kinase [Geminicoccales bacterium]